MKFHKIKYKVMKSEIARNFELGCIIGIFSKNNINNFLMCNLYFFIS